MSVRAGALLPAWPNLRGRSVSELGVRGRQWIGALSERIGISSQIRVPDDRTFARTLVPGGAGLASATAPALLERFRARTTPHFFTPFSHCEDVVAALRSRWPELEARVLEKAEGIRHGRFDVLGHSNLDFGIPVDWHRDPASGVRPGRGHWSGIDHMNPEVAGDYKLIWELNRHQYFTTLGKAYWYTRDEHYAAMFVEHLMAWMDANPPKLGINWASSLEASFRVISWIWGLYFFKTSPCITPVVFLRTLKFLYLQGRHIETYLSTYSSPNTHLTGEAMGLLYLGILFPEFRLATRWQRVGWAILVEQLGKHVRPDGSYFEQSTYYHRYTTDFCLHLSILGQLNGLPVEAAIHGKLRALLDHLMYLTQPDGSTPLVGDDDGGRILNLDERAPNDFRAALSTGAVLFDRPDYRYVAGEAAEETVWLLGPVGLRAFDGLQSVPHRATSRAFPDGGYYVMRDGWGREANSLLIDCGPHGVLNCGHAHADALGFTLVAGGTPVLIDPGTYTYTAPKEQRDHFRSTAAHNTVTVAGQSSSIPGGPFSWQHVARSSLTAWTPGLRCDYFEGMQDGYARLTPPALHSRAVLFLKGDYWIVRDRIATDGDHDVELHLHFAPGIALEILSPNRAIGKWGRDPDPEVLEIGVFGHQGVLRGGEGWVSTSYGALSRAPTCAFTARARGPRELVSFFVPWSGRQDAIEIQERPASNGRGFTVVRPGVEDVLLVGAGANAASGDLSTDAAWAWVRQSRGNEQPSEFVMVQGRYLAWRGRKLVQADAHVRRLAARLEGSELHVELDPACLCDVDLLGADRMVVNGVSAPAPSVTVS
jgi:heparinase II/III-like protein